MERGSLIDTLEVTRAGYRSYRATQLNPLNGPVEVVLEHAPALTLVAVDPAAGGQPVPHYQFRVAFQPGTVEVSQRIGGRVKDRLYHRALSGPEVHLPRVPPGEYQATYRSDDGKLLGVSPWTPVLAGQENWLAVPTRGAEGEVIGEWTPDDPEGEMVIRSDVTSRVREGTVLDVIFSYRSGHYGCRPSEVALLENGVPVATDTHPGIAGLSRVGNGYRVSVTNWKPEAVYEIRARAEKQIGGADSYGVVLLHAVNSGAPGDSGPMSGVGRRRAWSAAGKSPSGRRGWGAL